MCAQLWGEAQCATLHEAALYVLRHVGLHVRHERALELLAAAGAPHDGALVRIPEDLVEQALGSAPRELALESRGGGPTLRVRQGETHFGTGPDCIYVRDPDSGERRLAVLRDVEEMAAFADALREIDFVMSIVLPSDVDNRYDDLSQFAAMLRGSGKPLVVSTPQAGDSLPAMRELAELCGSANSLACLVMPSPPLQFEFDSLDKIMTCAELGVPVVVAPAPSAGTTAPASIAATVAVGAAEALAGLVVHQLTREGAPFVFGVGAARTHMRTAVDAYFLPEHFLGNHAGADLARFYGLPSWAYAGTSDAKSLDQQWSLEAAVTAVLGGLSRATLLHDVGYLESGMQASYESLLLGSETVAYARALMRPVPVDEDALALEEIAAAGPGGNHLASKYTRAHHREAWDSDVFDFSVYERWRAAGERSLLERLRERVAELRAGPRTYALAPEVEVRLGERLAWWLEELTQARGART
jgi:trimethylamine---corrinoid protein Co-methyltransferase